MGITITRHAHATRRTALLVIGGILLALFVHMGLTGIAHANTVAAINVSQARQSSAAVGYVEEKDVIGIWSTFNGSEPPQVSYDGTGWRVILPDYYEIIEPVVEPFRATYGADGSLQTRALRGYYICRVITYSGNEVILTIRQGLGGSAGYSVYESPVSFYEIVGMTWYDGAEVHDISHMWDGTHRRSSTWFYFDENGTLVTL